MKHLRALLTAILAIGAAAAAAQTPAHLDDYAALVAACGKPVSVTSKPLAASGPHAVNRDVKYPKLEFFIMKNDDVAWTTIGVFRLHGNDTIDREAAELAMPCLKNDRNAYPLETSGAAPVAAPVETSWNGWVIAAIGLGLVIAMVLAMITHARDWANRPKMLCMNCKSIQQPMQTKAKQWYCPVCTHGTPVPLNSPAALEYMTHR